MSSAGKTTRVGAAVFAVGLSLAGPQAIGTAAADEGESGTVAAPPAQTAKAGATRAGAAADRSESQVPAAAAEAAQPTTGSEVTEGSSRRSSQSPMARAARVARPAHRDRAGGNPRSHAHTNTVSGGPAEARTSAAQPGIAPAGDTAAAPAATKVGTAPPAFIAAAPARALAVASLPTGTAAASGDIFSTLFGPIGSLFEGIALLIRRTLFNQAPTVNPVQLTGMTTGLITGTLNAVDPEGDPLTFEVIAAPTRGSVVIRPDGTFVYTPDPDYFTGRDSFNVAVTDAGFHINLLDPFRPASTEAYTQVAQNALAAMLTFSFAYGTGSQYWTPEARDALEASASRLAAYIVVTTPTMLSYTVTAEKSPSSSTLASAGSDLSGTGSGFFPTVVQEKILTGIDPNGSKADGDIDWNFGNPWAFGSVVSSSQYDFTSTAMHELLHTFGFLSYTDEAGYNTGRSWTTFDDFIVTSDGTAVISDTFRFNTAYNTNLTGGDGGLYFGGSHAVAAYGGYVPLYTPRPWESGSSTSHLDDDIFTGSNTQLMNAVTDTGLGIRVLSPVELAILKDLGYTVTDSPVYAVVFIGFAFLRRRRRAA